MHARAPSPVRDPFAYAPRLRPRAAVSSRADRPRARARRSPRSRPRSRALAASLEDAGRPRARRASPASRLRDPDVIVDARACSEHHVIEEGRRRCARPDGTRSAIKADAQAHASSRPTTSERRPRSGDGTRMRIDMPDKNDKMIEILDAIYQEAALDAMPSHGKSPPLTIGRWARDGRQARPSAARRAPPQPRAGRPRRSCGRSRSGRRCSRSVATRCSRSSTTLTGRLGSSVQYAHRNLDGLSDDDLRRSSTRSIRDLAIDRCRPSGFETRSAARRACCIVSACAAAGSHRRRVVRGEARRRDRRGPARRCLGAARASPARARSIMVSASDHRSGGAPVQHRARARPLHARPSIATAVGAVRAVHAARHGTRPSATTKPKRTRSPPSS